MQLASPSISKLSRKITGASKESAKTALEMKEEDILRHGSTSSLCTDLCARATGGIEVSAKRPPCSKSQICQTAREHMCCRSNSSTATLSNSS